MNNYQIYATHIDRGHTLLELNRIEQALEEFTKALSFDPLGREALTQVTICQINLRRYDVALENINALIANNPDFDFGHYLLAHYYHVKEKYQQAEEAIVEAIKFAPHTSSYFAKYAQIKLETKNWEKALELSNIGLALDPEDSGCLNTRANALNKLNKKDELAQTVDKLLEINPNDAYSHANVGWAKLEQNDHEGARKHFIEALRIDPNYNYAKDGLMQSIKAKNPIYRVFLQYSLWFTNLQQYAMLLFFVGFIFLQKFLSAQENTWAQSAYYFLLAFALSSWVVNPIGNLFLRIDPMGKFLLSAREKISSNITGVGLVISILTFAFSFFIKDDEDEQFTWRVIAGVTFVLTVLWSKYIEEEANAKNIKYNLAMVFFSVTALICYCTCFFPEVLFMPKAIQYFFSGFAIFTWISSFITKS